MEKIVWGIDPGSSICGICELKSGLIGNCFNETPNSVYKRIMTLSGANSITVVIEGLSAYSKKLSNDTIDTGYLIGELRYRFNTNPQVTSVHLIERSPVRSWIFKTVPDVCIPRVIARMEYIDKQRIKKGLKGLRDKTGKLYEPHFKFVDDRIVIAALKSIYNIPTPKPGKSNIFGLKDHSWQSLALIAYFSHIGKNTNETQKNIS